MEKTDTYEVVNTNGKKLNSTIRSEKGKQFHTGLKESIDIDYLEPSH